MHFGTVAEELERYNRCLVLRSIATGLRRYSLRCARSLISSLDQPPLAI
jgi:hypothetical protein